MNSHGPFCACCSPQLIPTINAGKKKGSNPLRRDPSRTTSLQNQFIADATRRFKALRRALFVLIVEEDALAIDEIDLRWKRAPVINAERRRWQFLTSDKKVEMFQIWLQHQINAGILAVGAGESPWTAKYIDSAYKKGLVRAWVDAHRADLDLSAPTGFTQGSQAQFLKSAFGSAESISKIRLIATRSYESLRGITASMSAQMARALADGLANGRGVLEIASDMAKAVDVGITRARVIARTEIMHAHAEGQLDSFEAMGVEEIGVMAEWSTAGDDRVCPICAPLQGVILTIKEARGLIPRHPNCRCTWIPANVTEKEAGQKRTKSRIASAITKSLQRETGKKSERSARQASTWAGADGKFSGKKTQQPLRG